jgi:hypothetical protein
MKRIALLLLLACAPAMADKFTDGEKLAKADLASTVTTAKLAGTWQLGPLYWDSVQKRTIGEARLMFAVDASDKLADAPFVASDKVVIDLGPPAKMVAHADPKKLKETIARIAEIDAALAIARAKLKTLPRYSYWVKEGWKYETRVTVNENNKNVLVVFDTPNVTDQSIMIAIDPTTKKVLSVRMGMA